MSECIGCPHHWQVQGDEYCRLGLWENNADESRYETPDTCPLTPAFADILRALPTATPEALSIIEAVLEGRYHVGEPADLMAIASSPYHPEKKITVLILVVKDTPCPTCGGSGETYHRTQSSCASSGVFHPCPTCNGTGKSR